jgi:putative hydrolase of the HAD superfamily
MIKVVLFDYGRVLSGPLPHPRVRRLAESIRGHGIKTGILSNTFFAVPLILRLTGGYRGFEPLVLSSVEGVAKPAPRIYQIAIERSGVQPQEILFIDNREENLDSAKKLGMKVVLAKNSKQIVTEVKRTVFSENGLEV